MADPYCLANGVLKNRYGLKTQAELDGVERDTAAVIEAEIYEDGYDGEFDSSLLLDIHRRLFSEVYEWAGQTRISPLSKKLYEDSDQVTNFSPPGHIGARLTGLMSTLPSRAELAGYDRTTLVAKMASTFVSLNNVHPFREGNGRTQRIFLRLFAKAAGQDMTWGVVTKERMINCSIAGSQGDPKPIARLFAEITDPERVQAMLKAVRFLQQNLPDWNDRYIATTVEGQDYSGILSGVAGRDFMMKQRENKEVGLRSGIPTTCLRARSKAALL